MRSKKRLSALLGAAFALTAGGGCGGDSGGPTQTDMAKLPPPSEAATNAAAKAPALPKVRPKFLAPPRSEMRKP